MPNKVFALYELDDFGAVVRYFDNRKDAVNYVWPQFNTEEKQKHFSENERKWFCNYAYALIEEDVSNCIKDIMHTIMEIGQVVLIDESADAFKLNNVLAMVNNAAAKEHTEYWPAGWNSPEGTISVRAAEPVRYTRKMPNNQKAFLVFPDAGYPERDYMFKKYQL